MDGPLPRRCGTCRFHRAGLTACVGRCQHPKLQPPAEFVRPLVRERELHCYLGWGRDFWEPKPSETWDRNGHEGGPRLNLDPADRHTADAQWQPTSGRARAAGGTEDDWNEPFR